MKNGKRWEKRRNNGIHLRTNAPTTTLNAGIVDFHDYVVCTHGVFNKTRIADTTYTYSLWREERSSTCTAWMVIKTGSRCGGR